MDKKESNINRIRIESKRILTYYRDECHNTGKSDLELLGSKNNLSTGEKLNTDTPEVHFEKFS